MFPIGDDNTGRQTTPFVVYAFVAVNVIVFLLEVWSEYRLVYSYAAIPLEITTGEDLVRPVRLAGGDVIPQLPGPVPIYLTILTSMFMHGGIMHILGNMLYLWIFGDNIEDNFGHLKFLAFYLICGVVAALAHILVDPTSVIPTVGASGAIAGVLGAYLVMFPRNRVRSIVPLGFLLTTVELPAVVVLGFWIVIQIISQYTAFTDVALSRGGVAYMAHIGGFAAGLLLSFFFRRHPRQQYDYDRRYES